MLSIANHPIYHHPLPEGHRFPMEKYSLLPQQLMREGTCTQENFFEPSPLSETEILKVHTQEYWNKLAKNNLSRQEERKTGFPLSTELVQREITIAGGTVENTFRALKDGISMNIAGGTHHAFTDRGEGFCLLNDIALGCSAFLQQYPKGQVLVVDLDVHQGNGTAQIFEKEDRVFTFSMHGGNNYPLHKEKSDRDVPLPDGISTRDYLLLLDQHLPEIIEKTEPDFIYYQAGVDILSTDKLGRLGVSLEGCKKRDQMVLSRCKENEIPLAVSMGGGYSPDLRDILEAHSNTFRTAQHLFF